MWSCTDAEFAPLTSSWVWGHYLCKLPMFLITRVFFFKPWLWQGRNKLVFKCKSVRCQHGNARMEFMCLQTKGDTERNTGIKQTRCTAKRFCMQGPPPRKGLKDKFLRMPDLCLSAPIFLQIFGQEPLCNRLTKKEEIKKKKLTELHIAFRNCSQRKRRKKQSETSNAVKLNKAFREFYVSVKGNPWLITSI